MGQMNVSFTLIFFLDFFMEIKMKKKKLQNKTKIEIQTSIPIILRLNRHFDNIESQVYF